MIMWMEKKTLVVIGGVSDVGGERVRLAGPWSGSLRVSPSQSIILSLNSSVSGALSETLPLHTVLGGRL